MNKYWGMVLIAGLLEIVWVSGLKHADNYLTWGVTVLSMLGSFYLMLVTMSRLPVGTVYAVFTGIGTAGTVITEILLFGETFNGVKVFFVTTLLVGVIGLKMVTSDDPVKEAKA